MQMPQRIASENKATVGVHCARQEALNASKPDVPLAILRNVRIGGLVNDFPAELERMLSAQKRYVVQDLQTAVRPDVLGPVAAQPKTAGRIGFHSNKRETEEL